MLSARAAHVDMPVVQHYDEHVESWLRRLNRQAMRAAALSAGIALNDQSYFDEDAMTALTRQIVEQAYSTGQCVIVGRGAQCILQRHQASTTFSFTLHSASVCIVCDTA